VCRRGATGGVARWRNIARRHAGRRNIGWWEEGRRSSGNRPADWRGVVPAAIEQRGEEMGDLRPDSRVCVFSHRQSGPVPAFLSSGVPKRAPGDR
jgi:hypothetical protein